MFRRSPCDLYLKYLIVHPDHLTDEAIERRAVAEQLDSGGRVHLTRLRSSCVPPRLFRPLDAFHDPSHRFLTKHNIRRLFFPDEHVETAFQILQAPRAKEFVEAMLLAEAPAIRIGQEVTRRFGVVCATEGINSYKRFFWDIDKLDTTERRTLIRMRAVATDPVDEALRDDPMVRLREMAYAGALEKAHYKDPRRIAVDLPSSPISSVIIQIYMGAEPSELDIGMLLHDTRRLAVLRANEEARGNMPGSAKRFRDWVAGLKDLKEIMEDSATPAQELEKHIQTLRLKTRPSSAPVLHQLSGGRHTIDLQPQSVSEEEEDESDAGTGTPSSGGADDPE
jgi:hypothetical protein